MANVSVLLLKRKKGCIKLCPVCDAKNTALATGCKKCKADLQKVKRSYAGKGFSYRIRWQDPETGRFREETVGSDLVLAKKRQGERLRELLNGEYREVKQISYNDFKEKYLSVCEKTKSEGHYDESERTLRFFDDVCKPANLGKIDFAMLEKYRDKRFDDDLSPATVNKEIRNLQAAFGYAVDKGFLKVNPIKPVRKKLMLKEPEPVAVIVEPEQYKACLDACPDARWKAMAFIAFPMAAVNLDSVAVFFMFWIADARMSESFCETSRKASSSNTSVTFRLSSGSGVVTANNVLWKSVKTLNISS